MAAARDWDELTRIILQTARTILPVVGDALFFHNRSSGSYDLVAHWSLDEHTGLLNISEKVSADCVMLLAEKMPQDEIYFGCKCSHDEVPDRRYQKLCLPLWKGDELVALLQLYMLSEVTLSREGLVLMKNLAGEMALILDHYQLQRRLVQQKEAVHEERYRIARHLHDTLAHNLAYLRLKLEQISNSEMGDSGPLRLEAKRLLDVSEQSYEIVRGLLFGLQENTPVDLTTAMKEYTASVSSRADFEINLNVVGEQQELPAEMNRQIFYMFREALRNVEKHARARRVDVQVAWENNVLCMEVADDGQGVDEAAVRSGFGGYGLNFIRETIEDLGGVFDFTSSRLKGTRLGIRIPL
jgi:signal transduction histidine kinase